MRIGFDLTPVSHREELEKALNEYARKQGAFDAADFPNARAFDRGAEIVGTARAEVLRLYDEKPPSREDLEAVAREAVQEGTILGRALDHTGGSVHECAGCSKLAAEVVTRYLASRTPSDQ